MSSFVLVHGGAHGAWCWERVVPHLERDARVDAVVAVDLTGHGARLDVKPLGEVAIADYVDDVAREIESRDLRDVVLVGHSLAGITLPAAAARVAARLRRVVYLATSNPAVGETIDELMKHPLSPVTRGAEFREMFCNDLDDETAAWLLGKLGPEPLENGFTAEYLAGIISGRRAPIKNLILDQQAIAGIGNMYADEALHRACVHPTQPGEDLSPAEIQRLHEAIKFVLHKGISDGGASVNTYFHPDGQSGKAQEGFKVAHGGSGSCLTCGTRLARMVVGGRGTYYCPVCQEKS